jgi:hypothetical protein
LKKRRNRKRSISMPNSATATGEPTKAPPKPTCGVSTIVR